MAKKRGEGKAGQEGGARLERKGGQNGEGKGAREGKAGEGKGKAKPDYFEEWKDLARKFGKMTGKEREEAGKGGERAKGEGKPIGGKKAKKVSKAELEREKEALRKFDEESLNRIWGGKILLKV